MSDTPGAAPEPAAELDARGLLCPLPVLKARKRIAALPSGAVLRILTTDPAAVLDVPHFCAEAGHAVIASGPDGEHPAGPVTSWLVRKG